MRENFLPIPSLNNLYEINPHGVVRNVATKKKLSAFVTIQSEKIHTSRTIASLLLEVHGIKKNIQNVHKIECSCTDGNKVYNFQSLKELAKFLAPKTHYKYKTVEDYLSKRKSEIGIWKIKYFAEPKANVKAEHKNKGKKYGRRIQNEI